jgi:hypothetical protein
MRISWRRTLVVLTVVILVMANSAESVSIATAKVSGLVHGGSCARVYWRSVRGGNQRCPVIHSILSDIYWSTLHWTSWTKRQAFGYGYEVHEQGLCSGEPVVCRDQLNPIDIHLSQPVFCSGGARIWSRIDIIERAPGSRRITGKAHWPYTCTPSEPSIGLGGGGG